MGESVFAMHSRSLGGGSVQSEQAAGHARCAHSPHKRASQVRVSRRRILESAVKVMELYARQRTVLELEYFGEVGVWVGGWGCW